VRRCCRRHGKRIEVRTASAVRESGGKSSRPGAPPLFVTVTNKGSSDAWWGGDAALG
jgi:hypothetical protein